MVLEATRHSPVSPEPLCVTKWTQGESKVSSLMPSQRLGGPAKHPGDMSTQQVTEMNQDEKK